MQGRIDRQTGVVFVRLTPSDSSYDRIVAMIRGEPAAVTVREAKDASGHEHADDGKFTGEGGHVEAFEKIHDRAGSDATLSHDDIHSFFDKLSGLDAGHLREIAAKMKWTVAPGASRKAILEKFRTHVTELKHTFDTTRPGFTK